MSTTACPSGPLIIRRLEQPNGAVRLSLVLPTYNESKNIPAIVKALAQVLDPVLPGAYELIVVDDDSPDESWRVAEELSSEYPQLRVVRRQSERGLATAVVRGWQCARGEVLGVIDADLQHPPEITAELWDEISRGADLAVGSRHVDGGGLGDWGFVRRALSRSAQLLGLLILPDVLGRLKDPMSGCFFVRRSAIEGRRLNPLGYKILLEIIGRGDVCQISEIGYVFRERRNGASKVSWRLYVEYLRHLIELRVATLATAQFLQFVAVGFSGVVVDMGLFYLLSDPSSLALGLVRSKMLAGEAAIVNNFWWNDVWTFRKPAQQQRGWSQRTRRLLKFNTICGLGLVLAAALLVIQFDYLGINRYVANAVAIAAVTLWNFCLNKQLSWGTASLRRAARPRIVVNEEIPPSETPVPIEPDRAA